MKKSWLMRLLALSLSVLMLVCLTACGGGEDTSAPGSSDVSEDVDAPEDNNNDTTDSSAPAAEDDNPTDTATTTKGKVTTTKGKTTSTKKNDEKEPVKSDVYVQQQFHISTFVTRSDKKILQWHKDAGFTMVDNAFKDREAGLQAAKYCEEVGMYFLMQNATEEMGYSGIGGQYPEFKESVVKSVVKEMKDYKYFEGWYTWDEVLTQDFAQAKKINDLFAKNDPNKAVYSILLPSYGRYQWNYSKADDYQKSDYYKYVTDFVEQVDPPILGFDYYPFEWGGGENADLVNSNLWRDMGLFRKLSLETGKPFWFYFQAYERHHKFTFTNAMRSAQMYGAIAYNVKCLSYYDTLRRLIADADGNKAPEFNDIKTLNAKVKNLGDYLFKKQNEELYHFGITSRQQAIYMLDDVSKSDLIVDGPKDTIVSVFGDGTSTKYVLVVNKQYKGGKTGTLTLKTNKKVRIYDHIKDKTYKISDKTKTIDVALNAGECALYIVE